MRYRYNKRDIQTPIFDATEYVRFDAVPEEIEQGLSPQFDNSRKMFDANASYSLTGWGALRVGYGHEAWERHGRGFSDVGDEHLPRVVRHILEPVLHASRGLRAIVAARRGVHRVWHRLRRCRAARSQAFDTTMKRIAIGAGPR